MVGPRGGSAVDEKGYRTPDVLVLDIETQRLFDEVGGPAHADRLGLALAVTYSVGRDAFDAFWEGDAAALMERLAAAALVVGFNLVAFDYRVLEPYAPAPLAALPTLDIMHDVRAALGRRVSLDALARATLGAAKCGSGLDAVRWFREGRRDLLEHYCRADVDITHRLFAFGLEHGYLLAAGRDGGPPLRLGVNWASRAAGALYRQVAAGAAAARTGGAGLPAPGSR